MENMKSRLEDEFKDDAIRREITITGLENNLYTDKILSIHTEAAFSTVEAGKILDKSDSTIRNHFRTDLVNYIAPEKVDNKYRLNYKSIFRLRMIFLLTDFAKKSTGDLLLVLGMTGAQVVTNGKRIQRDPHSRGQFPDIPTVPSEDINALKMLIQQSNERNDKIDKKIQVFELERDLQLLEKHLLQCSFEISYLELDNEKRITQIQFQFLQDRQDEFYKLSRQKKKSGGFFKIFSKQDNDNITNEFDSLTEKLKKELDEKIRKDIKENNDKIDALSEEKKSIIKAIDKKKKELEALEVNIESKIKALIANVEDAPGRIEDNTNEAISNMENKE